MPLTKITYAQIKGATVSVLDYGADPTGVADSTAAITSALAAVVASGAPGVVTVPAGTYKCTSSVFSSQ